MSKEAEDRYKENLKVLRCTECGWSQKKGVDATTCVRCGGSVK